VATSGADALEVAGFRAECPRSSRKFASWVEKEMTDDMTGTSGEPQVSGDPTRQISAEATAGAAAGGGSGERWVTCEIPGCVNEMRYSGRGAPPKYCGQTVEGFKHTRLTAYRLNNGQITLPAPGSGGATPPPADPDPVAPGGEVSAGGDGRPVSAARMTLELLLSEVAAAVAGHEQRMGVLAGQISAAVRTATSPDAAVVEVSAAHRAARADIDAAEAERDQAALGAREAARAAQESQERTELAEAAAEEALAELERAEAARDEAIGARDDLAATEAQLREERDTAHAHAQSVQAEWDRTSQRLAATAGELTAARAQIETLRDQLAAVRQEAADLAVARTELTAQLADERHAVETQRRRAEAAEHDATRAAGQLDHLATELATARGQVEHWQAQAGEYRAELAGVRSELTAAHTTIEAEKTHAGQRLADQQARYEDLVSELRTQIEALRPAKQRERTGRAAPPGQQAGRADR
jgi:predicted  nucleic acid-binding Zn-ribbon protein